jgi:SAM-dependent MidA family methyltransferase
LRPPPLADVDESAALAASDRLVRRIRHEIDLASGWISFARYMELALYEPGLGYYARGAMQFGKGGDFTTAPELTSLFGRTLARQFEQILREQAGDILELGAGSAQLACDVLHALWQRDCLPERYLILELSATLRARQKATIQALPQHLQSRIGWIEHLPTEITGVIFANEVLDAVPTQIVLWREDGIYSRGVSVENGRFTWTERKLEAGLLLERAQQLPVAPPYISEINLASSALVRTLGERLRQGVILLIDYGFVQREFYHPQRNRGTLMCHYRHRSHDDPFFLPGLQDITSHVDFTAAARAGVDCGLRVLGYTTQAHFLINLGITDLLAQTGPEDTAMYLPLAAQANTLLSPAEMGELFKVLALGRDVNISLLGYNAGDKSALL